MLLFRNSYVIYVLFRDVETEKIGSFCVTGRSNIAIFSEQKIFRIFCKKEEDLPLFHKILEGLNLMLAISAEVLWARNTQQRNGVRFSFVEQGH